ncbi:MAG: hypothetical protein ACUVXF_00530 [Desulfobaccales bacterium]
MTSVISRSLMMMEFSPCWPTLYQAPQVARTRSRSSMMLSRR